MSPKSGIALLVLCLLLSVLSFSTQAARPHPRSLSPKETDQVQEQQSAVEEEQFKDVATEKCEGLNEEECLMRRTLAAHVDYIYTQRRKNNP